jgi:serine/threonine protein kinase
MLHRQLPSGAIGVDLASAIEVLLDVAYAMQYLHSLGLVHGDVKMENILLKSDHSRRLGVTPKVRARDLVGPWPTPSIRP